VCRSKYCGISTRCHTSTFTELSKVRSNGHYIGVKRQSFASNPNLFLGSSKVRSALEAFPWLLIATDPLSDTSGDNATLLTPISHLTVFTTQQFDPRLSGIRNVARFGVETTLR
jgi:hypothetical protein